MKVIIAIDSFKGSLSSMEAGSAIKEGIRKAKPDAEIIVKPLADGGEGTTDALISGLGGKRIDLTVTGPMGEPVDCYYGILENTASANDGVSCGHTAVMEMASAAGITLLPDGSRNPLEATTYGVGEMILHAMENGCLDFVIGIGGSATNDGGIGMLKALGFEFLDKYGCDVGEGGQALSKVSTIKSEMVNSKLALCNFKVACDVTNPLCGENGATYIYGPQKGVTLEMREDLDQGMANFAAQTAKYFGTDFSDYPGAGAAGGLGFTFLSYLNAALTPGIDLIINAVGLESELLISSEKPDVKSHPAGRQLIVVTGEGRLDHQTAMGKAPVGVARLAKKYGAKVIAFAGSVTEDAIACNEAGIDAFFPIVRNITTLEEAMKPENAKKNLAATAEQVFRLL